MIPKLSWIPAAILALGIVWAPLPFGSVGVAAAATLQLIAAAALAAAAAAGPISGALRRVRWPASACVAIALLGLVGSLTYSIAPSDSREAARQWLAVAALLGAGAVAGVSRRRRRLLAAAFAAIALFEVVYGIRNWLAGSRSIWGVFVQSQSHRVKGTFVNPNHFATFVLLALAAAAAWLWWSVRRARRERRPGVKALLVGAPLVVWMALLTGLALSGSRSGILAAAAGLVAQAAAIAASMRRRRVVLAALALLLAAGVALVVAVAGSRAFDRLLVTRGSDVSAGARLEAAAAALPLVARRPILGYGLGSFEDAFAAVIPPALVGSTWQHLHNDPLELWITGGTLALALAATGVAGMARRLVLIARRGDSSEDRAAGIFGVGALAAVGVQELFEFGLTLPANAFAAAALLGAALAARVAVVETSETAGAAGAAA
jgi:O-antigen ligase